ncbi:MAG: PEP-CTERM sorting domain-containing protein, partial [Rhizobacter sp.]
MIDSGVTAVPEPESYALLLLGLGVMAAAARRRAGTCGGGAAAARGVLNDRPAA